jgi:single-strand DNA-binding protein
MMMKDINKVILVGRLGADPIQRKTKSGYAVTHFSMATSRSFTREESPQNGEAPPSSETVEETQWHQIVTWGKLAEACGQYLKKGNAVYVEGYFRSQNYESKTGGQRTSFEVHVENMSFLGGKSAVSSKMNGGEIPVPTEVSA